MEFDVRQGLCQAVCNHLLSWNVRELDSFRGHFVTDIVMLDVNMLCSGVEDGVVSKSYGALIVTLQRDGNAWWRFFFFPPSGKDYPGPG